MRTSAAFFAAFILLAGASRVGAVTIYAVDTSNNLLRFDSATPGTIQATTPITGLPVGETIHGIDFREGSLYGLGSSSRLYSINAVSGGAFAIGSPGAFTLSGSHFGFDFDPITGLARVVSNTGQNLRLSAFSGTIVSSDPALDYAAGDPFGAATPNIVGAAYSNNIAGATSSTLYHIDAALNILTTQNPADSGQLNTVGALNVNPGNQVGFDIASVSGINTAFVTMRAVATTELYTINLFSGGASQRLAVGGNPDLVDMTVSLVAQNFVVTQTIDPGDGVCDANCTLREAIGAANANPGRDIISFNIPGGGVKTILPSTLMTPITDPLVIDGYSQPGASPNTLSVGNNAVLLIQLDGQSGGNVIGGLVIRAARCLVRGLVINRYPNAGILVQNPQAPAVTATIFSQFDGNFIGTDASGSVDLGNGTGVRFEASSNFIGAPTESQGNVISGNGTGIEIATGANNVLVEGNYIGTDRNGTAALGNSSNGILVRAAGTRIGLAGPGARGNLISGNGASGIEVAGASATNTTIENNFIGINANGDADLGNANDGVRINGAPSNTVGGAVPGARNVIAGNNDNGVLIGAPGATNNRVLGNRIGTDATGQVNLANTFSGVSISAPANFVGGTAPGEGNAISGSLTGVVVFGSSATGNRVEGNLIGSGSASGPRGNNLGINLTTDSTNTTVGGPGGAANTISFNLGTGVSIGSGSTGNGVTGNSIFSNSGLGIDLRGGVENGSGVTANDPLDADSGSNYLQNFPVLSTAPGSSAAGGTLHSSPNATFTIHFYANDSCDASGHGEGQTFLGQTTASTNGSGNATFTFPLPSVVATGSSITATATEPGDATSEFSQCIQVTPLKITSITRLGSGAIRLQGLGVPNELHTMQASDDLSPGSFGPLMPRVAVNGAGLWQHDDAGSVGQTKRFYRLAFP